MKYLINKNTLYLEKNNYNNYVIIEDINKINYSSISIKKIIDDSCKNYGSSYYGRKLATKYLININSKVPIILSEIDSLIIFPIYSDRKSDNIWIVFNNIKNYYKKNDGVEIVFINDLKKYINCSYYMFNQQYLICCKLCTVFFLKK